MQRKEFYIVSVENGSDVSEYEGVLNEFNVHIEQMETVDMLSCATVHIPVWKISLTIDELSSLPEKLGCELIVDNDYTLYHFKDDYDVIEELEGTVLEIYDGYRE
ncbi:hypothetical protein PQ478_09060 [Alkalihalophilus pseudofirmus]|uniref:hypothetical protein n=1 Tax=Alkalihalophilus pseudofirmus TaxID=79885 RepID=UPI00259B65BE|nr:hypothetical protein [Alkalihalophilus pseudofirmus]WEG18620.1 hypothetical protein PQ478_09060 [Alkalihalophilus pseudofirmus]